MGVSCATAAISDQLFEGADVNKIWTVSRARLCHLTHILGLQADASQRDERLAGGRRVLKNHVPDNRLGSENRAIAKMSGWIAQIGWGNPPQLEFSALLWRLS